MDKVSDQGTPSLKVRNKDRNSWARKKIERMSDCGESQNLIPKENERARERKREREKKERKKERERERERGREKEKRKKERERSNMRITFLTNWPKKASKNQKYFFNTMTTLDRVDFQRCIL